PSAGIQIAVYDTKGTPAGAQEAVGTALKERAEIILGPLFSAEVSAVAPQARQAGVSAGGFSFGPNRARPGLLLLGFLPSRPLHRVVSYSASQGRKSFAALLPANAYGAVVEAAFRRSVAARGGRIVAIQSYQSNAEDAKAKATAVAALAPQIDALLM